MTLSDYYIPTLVVTVLSMNLFFIIITLVERIGRRSIVLMGMAVMTFILLVNMLSARAYLWGFGRWDLGIPQALMLPYGALFTLIQLYTAEVACSFGSGLYSALLLLSIFCLFAVYLPSICCLSAVYLLTRL